MSSKRKRENNNDDDYKDKSEIRMNKKQRMSEEIDLNFIIDESWISASKTRNYIIGDPLLDYLQLYGEKQSFSADKNNSELTKGLNFSSFIMNKGHEFEEFVINENLITKFGDKIFDMKSLDKVYNLIKSKNKNWKENKEEKYSFQLKETYRLMSEGVPIIYQGLLANPDNKTFGYPDLIVRSDYLNQISCQPIISNSKIIKPCRFSNKWHYRIVDIKFTKLKLKIDGKHLSKNPNVETYKSQLYIYNRALGYMQNLVPGKAYLLGRGWETTKNYSTYPLDKLVQIDFYHEDIETKEDTESAIEWLSDLKENGSKWKVLPKPSRPELYPNMNNDMDFPWHEAKKIIAEELKEVTTIWQCGIQQRELLHSKNIYGWNEKKCNAANLGLTGKINPKLVDAILDINKSKSIYKYDKSYKEEEWKINDDLSIFIDFETVSDINNVKQSNTGMDIIFMIGYGIIEKPTDDKEMKDNEDNWIYDSFITEFICQSEEQKICEQFIDSIVQRLKTKEKNVCKMYHYSSAEPNAFNKAIERYELKIPFEIVWIDLLKVIKNYCFVIKGCFNFSLKSIVSALSNHELIDLDYSNCEITNGNQAMLAAFKADEEIKKNRALSFAPVSLPLTMRNVNLIKLVTKYNEVDCKTLMAIQQFLQKTIDGQ